MNSTSFIFWLQILCFLDAALMGSTAYSSRKEKSEHLNIIIEDLESQGWDAQETQCFELLIKIMRNVQNSTLWASWIWDSMQNPFGHLYQSKHYNYGNYEECVDFPWEKVNPEMRTQYCLAHIKLSEEDLQLDEINLFGDVNNYLLAKTKQHLKLNTLKWGICTPLACDPRSIVKLVSVLFRHTHLGLATDKPNITIVHCHTAEDDMQIGVSYDWGHYFMVLFLIFIAVFAPSVTYIVSNCNLDHRYSDVLTCFHIAKNVDYLTKVTNNDVRSLFGVKVLCCIFVTGFHVAWIMRTWTMGSATIGEENDISLPLTLTTDIVIDTFQFMSGLLFIKGLMTAGPEEFNPLKTVVKRYIRLTRNLFLVILVIVTSPKYVQLGPEISCMYYNTEVEDCRKNWWASLLMIQNYYDAQDICHPVCWYLAVDFQLSVIAAVMYWVYSRNKRHGIRLFLITLIVSIAVPAAFVFSDHQRFRPKPMDVRITDNFRDIVFNNELYIHTHLRAVSYFVGMAMGYVMVTYNPNNHRNKIAKIYSILAFCAVVATFQAIFVFNNDILKRDYNPVEGALYLSLRRLVWAVLIGIFVTVCEYGTLPLVNKFLNWSVLVPISKLTPGIYIVHLLFAAYCSGTTRNPNQYDFMGVVINTCGVFVLSTVSSLFMWALYEAPVQNLTSLLLGSGKKQVARDAIKENGNGIIAVEKLSNKKEI